MEYLAIMFIGVLTLIAIIGGFYFGYKIGKGEDIIDKIIHKHKTKPIKNSIVDRNDEELENMLKEQEIEEEQKRLLKKLKE